MEESKLRLWSGGRVRLRHVSQPIASANALSVSAHERCITWPTSGGVYQSVKVFSVESSMLLVTLLMERVQSRVTRDQESSLKHQVLSQENLCTSQR